MIIVHAVVKPAAPGDGTALATVQRKALEPAEPIPPGAVWIDLVEPMMEEDRKVHPKNRSWSA